MRRTHYLGTAAIIGLTAGLIAASGPAQAFDRVYWSWDKNKDENIWVNKWVWGWFHPSGEVQVEKLQIFIGNVTASADLQGDFSSVTIEGGEATATFNHDVAVSIDYDDQVAGENNNNPIETVLFSDDQNGVFSPTTTIDGVTYSWPGTGTNDVDEADNGVNFVFNVDGTVTVQVDPEDLLQDAVAHLGHATQNVSAVGIVDSIDSAVPVMAHEGQFLLGGADDYNSGYVPFSTYTNGGEGNQFHDLAVLAGIAVVAGLVEKAEISASANAGNNSYDYYNDPVELAIQQDVQAVGAVAQINLEALNPPAVIQTVNANNSDSNIDTGDTVNLTPSSITYIGQEVAPWLGVFRPVATDLIVEADITQFAYADVTATASSYQDLTSFNNLGSYDRLGTAGLVAAQNVTAAGLVGQINVNVAP